MQVLVQSSTITKLWSAELRDVDLWASGVEAHIGHGRIPYSPKILPAPRH